MISLLILSFYRETILSILYVSIVVGVYLVKGRFNLSYLWPGLVIFLAAVLVGQYWLAEVN